MSIEPAAVVVAAVVAGAAGWWARDLTAYRHRSEHRRDPQPPRHRRVNLPAQHSRPTAPRHPDGDVDPAVLELLRDPCDH